MKKENIYGIQNNLCELKDKLNTEYLVNDTAIFRKAESIEDVKNNLTVWLESWVIPLINDTIDKSYDK